MSILSRILTQHQQAYWFSITCWKTWRFDQTLNKRQEKLKGFGFIRTPWWNCWEAFWAARLSAWLMPCILWRTDPGTAEPVDCRRIKAKRKPGNSQKYGDQRKQDHVKHNGEKPRCYYKTAHYNFEILYWNWIGLSHFLHPLSMELFIANTT
jgi:hypothetical protein